jgi:adenosylcobyric acid synthase
MAKSLMVLGCASDVGKSVLCAGLCRIFAQSGWAVAPFKAQNMSLNSAITPSGREIGRAQAVQAEAAGILPNEHMNPVLLKPTSDYRTQVVLQGRVFGHVSAQQYFYGTKDELWHAIVESYQYLADRYDLIVMEGAGSPVEMNLKDRDIANLRIAEMADANILLVADIERGGVFASIVGTLALMAPHERCRVKGLVINKFRGDPELFRSGVAWLEEYTGIPVLGVIPYLPHLGLEAEDSLALKSDQYQVAKPSIPNAIRIVVALLPHLANFTDLDPLFLEQDVEIWFDQDPASVSEGVDAVILPGTKNTMDDLQWLNERGWTATIQKFADQGGTVFGICGGLQMMGTRVLDPHGMESSSAEIGGLGLFSYETVLTAEKQTRLVEGEIVLTPFYGMKVKGYEIHMGETNGVPAAQIFSRVHSQGHNWGDGVGTADGALVGTYLHGIFHNDVFRTAWLNRLRQKKGIAPLNIRLIDTVKSLAYDQWADHLRAHLAWDYLHQWLGTPPASGER